MRVIVDAPPGLRVGRLARRRRHRRDRRRGARQRRVRRPRRVATRSRRPPTPTGVDAARARPLARRRCSHVPTADKVALALELEAATARRRPARPRRRVGVLRRRRGRSRDGELARRRGVDPAHGVLVLRVRDGGRGHRHPDRQRLLGRAELRRPRRATSRRTTPPSGPSGSWARSRSRRRTLPVVLRPAGHPLAARACSAARSSGEAIVKGRSLFVGREGEEVAGPGITLVDDPTLADAFGAATHDAEGVPTRRVELIAGGRFDAVPAQRVHRAPGRRAHDRVRRARRVQVAARRRRARAAPRARVS